MSQMNLSDQIIHVLALIISQLAKLTKVDLGWFALISEQTVGRKDYPSFDAAGLRRSTIWKKIWITMLHHVPTNTIVPSREFRSFFDKDNLNNTLGRAVLETSWETADPNCWKTENTPLRNRSFSGGRETEFKGERRLFMSSPKRGTYGPQARNLSALEIVAKINPEN